MPAKYKKDVDLEQARLNREQARLNREVTFEGKACRRCAGRERYTSNGGCIYCVKGGNPVKAGLRRDAAKERREALNAGKVKYISPNPCKTCGGYDRYVMNGGCVSCVKLRAVKVREIRAALYHSTTSPVVWVNEPPSPETAPLYAMCPTLAAYAGQWTAVYSDAQHLSPGARIFPGCDVLKRPAALQMMLNDKNHPGHAIAIHLAPAYYAALRAFNDKVTKR